MFRRVQKRIWAGTLGGAREDLQTKTKQTPKAEKTCTAYPHEDSKSVEIVSGNATCAPPEMRSEGFLAVFGIHAQRHRLSIIATVLGATFWMGDDRPPGGYRGSGRRVDDDAVVLNVSSDDDLLKLQLGDLRDPKEP